MTLKKNIKYPNVQKCSNVLFISCYFSKQLTYIPWTQTFEKPFKLV